MFIVFEGIDGSGKTTISNRVAKVLRDRGQSVEHVREGGQFALAVVQRMREFGKDRRNFELVPLAELMLFMARDAQVIAESIRPALATHDVVFADRYIYSYEALACDGRGLDRARVQPVLRAVAGGLWPDLVVLCDVDPYVARARRKVRKLARGASGESGDGGGGSRKALGGVGVNHRVRTGYLELARREPDRWLVVDNTFTALDDVVAQVAGAIDSLRSSGSARTAIAAARRPFGEAPAAAGPSFAAAEEAFYAFIEDRARREPGVAAYFLAGLDTARAYAWRERLVDAAPAVIASGLRGLASEAAWRLRERLVEVARRHVAKSLHGSQLALGRKHAMLARLVDMAPTAVLAAIHGDQSLEAWSIRRALAATWLPQTVSSARYNDGAEAWALRDELAARPGAFDEPMLARPLAASLRGLVGDRAWELRRRLFDAAPVAVLGSLTGVFDDEAWRWRARHAARAAKVVMRTFDGSEDERAWQLRADHAEAVKETLDSMLGLDGDEAWALRERCVDVWPSTTVKTVVPLAHTDRATQLAMRALGRHPCNISLLKHAMRMGQALADRAALSVDV